MPSLPSLPSLFVSHGAPNMVLSESDVRAFVSNWGEKIPRPSSIVIVSAHFETVGAAVVSDAAPGMIYDFSGFEPELYKMTYPAPGDPDLAHDVFRLIRDADLPINEVTERGYDHGTWVPLSLMYPDAEIPVVQVSIDPDQDAHYHFQLGQALSPLREKNVLIIGSGQITHNLRAVFQRGRDSNLDNNINAWVDAFVGWMDEMLDAGDLEAVLDFANRAPFARENHPTDEHLMPLFVALGAAGKKFVAKRRHSSKAFGFMAMDAYEFSTALPS